MATEKQIEYIKKLCGWKKEPFNEPVIRSLSESQASEEIDRLKALPSAKGGANGATSSPKPARRPSADNPFSYDGVRAGLAMKVIAQKSAMALIEDEPDVYALRVAAMYKAMVLAEDAIRALELDGGESQ